MNNYKCIVLICLLSVACFFCPGCDKSKDKPVAVPFEVSNEIPVRVLLFENLRECTLEYSRTGLEALYNAQKKQSFPVIQKTISVRLDGSSLLVEGLGEITISDDTLPFLIAGPDVLTGACKVNGKQFRGRLNFHLDEDGKSFYIVNELGLEAYLGGVITSEMPAYWDIEALKAQSITARTYCLFIRDSFGKNRNWDVRSSQANQVYRGTAGENSQGWEAIKETKGLVLTIHDSSHHALLFPAYYSSICGGHTENSKYVFGDSYACLEGVRCDYCLKVTKRSTSFWDPIAYSLEEISEKLLNRYPSLSNLDGIKNIEATRISKYGSFNRVNGFYIHGMNGKRDFLRGEDFRLSIDPSGQKLKSTTFEFRRKGNMFFFENGRGFGHCVGLCQYGALGMAREGKKVDEILGWYYPGAIIQKIELEPKGN